MSARFDRAFTDKIRRGVRRYQKERSKLKRAGITDSDLPPRVTLKGLLNQFYTKRTMNVALKEMSLFTAGKAKKIVSIGGKDYSQYDIEKFRLQLGRERKATTRELSRMTGFDAVSPLAHNQYIKRLEARQKELSSSWKNIIGTRAGAEVAAKAIKSEKFYENWIYAFFQDAEKLGFSEEKRNAIIKKLNKLTPQQFERLFAEDPAIGYIFSYYNMSVAGGKNGRGRIASNEALDSFNELYERIDITIDRYINLK